MDSAYNTTTMDSLPPPDAVAYTSVDYKYKHPPPPLIVVSAPPLPSDAPYHGEDASSFLIRSMFTENIVPTDPKLASCPQCGKWVSKRKLTQHIRTHTHEKNHQCESCDRAFSRVEHLHRHRLIHTGEKPHECTVCDKRFGRNDHLRTHMRIHTGEKPHKCDECGKSFMRSDHKLKHMNSHVRKEFVSSC